jgi:hypothetical protein
MSKEMPILREPYAESTDLYPGLVVHDGRVTGSITAGRSRLPLWAFMPQTIVSEGEWDGYEPETYEWTRGKASEFLYHLLEMRGEFARLLCVLADVDRREDKRYAGFGPGWWAMPTLRRRAVRQLRRCLETLEQAEREDKASQYQSVEPEEA